MQPTLAEPEVVRRDLEEERDDRHRGYRREGLLFSALRSDYRRQEPRHTENER